MNRLIHKLHVYVGFSSGEEGIYFDILKNRTNVILFLRWYRGLIFSNESKEE